MKKDRPGPSPAKPSPGKRPSPSRPAPSKQSSPAPSRRPAPPPSKGSSFTQPAGPQKSERPSQVTKDPNRRPMEKDRPVKAPSADDRLKEKMRLRKESAAVDKAAGSPGPKIRPDGSRDEYAPVAGSTADTGYQEAPAAGTGKGKGCCSSIWSIIALIAVLSTIVILVLLSKC